MKKNNFHLLTQIMKHLTRKTKKLLPKKFKYEEFTKNTSIATVR